MPGSSFQKIFFLLALSLALSGCGQGSQTPGPAVSPPASSVPSASIPPGRFLFSAPGCIHCQEVAAYVQEHDIRRQMYYIEQTVGSNGPADAVLQAIADRCSIPASDVAVPLFWDGAACHMGSDQVITYFEQQSK